MTPIKSAFGFFMGKTTAGTSNEITRVHWIREKLSHLAPSLRLLDAGAGEQQFRKYCTHLQYVSQDFGRYDGVGNNIGLQTGHWNNLDLDIVSDITEIPEPDDSFDVVLCTEVFEHLPNPILAIKEFSRLLKDGGQLIITAPFCSLTHFSPFHFYSGFNRYFYEKFLLENGFNIIELKENGNYFEYIAQEVRRISSISQQYLNIRPRATERLAIALVLKMLGRFSQKDNKSSELLNYGFHIHAVKKCEK